jgi:hypothetical protein
MGGVDPQYGNFRFSCEYYIATTCDGQAFGTDLTHIYECVKIPANGMILAGPFTFTIPTNDSGGTCDLTVEWEAP